MALTPDSPIRELFETMPQPLRGRLLRKERRFRDMGFLTVGTIAGSLSIEAPPDFDKARAMVTTARGTFKKASNPNTRRRQFARTFRLDRKEVEQLTGTASSVPRVLARTRRSRSESFFGALGPTQLRSTRDFRVVSVESLGHSAPRHEGKYILPDLQSRLGPVWDQGRRGTCTSFACTALMHYLNGSGGERPSPQFLYHQSKMWDHKPNTRGTSVATAIKIMADGHLSGAGSGWATSDSGVPPESAWPYVPHANPSNHAYTPPPADMHERIYEGPRWGNTRGEVIRFSQFSRSIVDELRTILRREEIPVAASLHLFPNMNNEYTRRTGRMFMPLEGEEVSGAHAWLVAGFDDEEGVFLVRNSWGEQWAPDNPWGFPGYALIPYGYFSQHGYGSFSMRYTTEIQGVRVPEQLRLYNLRRVDSMRTTISAADLGRKSRSMKKRATRTSPRPRRRGILKRLVGIR